MLSLLRFSPRASPASLQRCIQPAIKQYARVADSSRQDTVDAGDKVLSILPPGGLPNSAIALAPVQRHIAKYNVQVKEDHGLYAFFRKEVDEAGKVSYHTVEAPEGDALFPSGRAWKASELRLKSFQDLHTLWYIVLRERNLLASQREEARRIGIQNPGAWSSSKKATLCRKTMARIKYVLNERRLAYEGAVKLLEAEKAEVKALKEDEKVLKYQLQEWRKGRALRKASRQRRRRPTETDATPILPSVGEVEDLEITELGTIKAELPEVTTTATVVEPDIVHDTPTSIPAPEAEAVLAPTTVASPAETTIQPAELAEQVDAKPRTRSERRAERQQREVERTLAAKDAPEGLDAAESSLFGGPIDGGKKKS